MLLPMLLTGTLAIMFICAADGKKFKDRLAAGRGILIGIFANKYGQPILLRSNFTKNIAL